MDIKNTQISRISKRGFTLIEMLVVVAVIGILATMIIIGLNSVRQPTRDARRAADLKQIQNGLEIYYSKNTAYPAATTWIADLQTATNSKIPSDPLGGSTVYYYCVLAVSGTNQRYTLGAQLEESNSSLINSSLSSTIAACAPAAGKTCGIGTPGFYCVGN